MFKQKPFPFSLLILVILIALHLTGSYYSLYWLYPWFDIVVHIFGGLWVALVILWLVSYLVQVNSLKEYKIKSFLIAIMATVFIGIIWELVENFTQITSVNASGYGLDTAGDILSGALGGVLAYFYFVRRKKSLDKNIDILHPFYNQTGIIKK